MNNVGTGHEKGKRQMAKIQRQKVRMMNDE